MKEFLLDDEFPSSEDNDALEDDWLAAVQDQGFQIINQAAEAQEVAISMIQDAKSSLDLLYSAREIAPDFISDRLEEIFSPFDVEDDNGGYEPELLLGSLREFLMFCVRMRGALDERFMPGRTYRGELGIQLLDERIGDLSIRFCENTYVLVAVVSDVGTSSGEYRASSLCTAFDHFNVARWI